MKKMFMITVTIILNYCVIVSLKYSSLDIYSDNLYTWYIYYIKYNTYKCVNHHAIIKQLNKADKVIYVNIFESI